MKDQQKKIVQKFVKDEAQDLKDVISRLHQTILDREKELESKDFQIEQINKEKFDVENHERQLHGQIDKVDT